MRCFFPLAVLGASVLTIAGCGSGSGTKLLPALSPTATTLTLGTGSALQGATISCTATVTGIVPDKTIGNLTIQAGSVVLSSVPIAKDGSVTMQLPLGKTPAGIASLVATYGGNAVSASSSSSAVSLAVQTTTTTSLSANAAPAGQPLLLTAIVSRSPSDAGNATGTVTFSNATQTIAAASLNNGGVATVVVPTTGLVPGTYSFSAAYSGDAVDLPSASATVQASVTPPADVLTLRNDNARTGVQSGETILTPATVSGTTFGKLFSFAIDGSAFAQPLYVTSYPMLDGRQHNVLIVASSAGSVYAFDADGDNPAAGYLWHATVLASGEQTVTPADTGCTDTQPNTSIIGTPVIDRAQGVVYLVGRSKVVNSDTTTYFQRVHALSLADGSEQLHGPTLITASVPGTGAGTVAGTIAFDPLVQNQRAGLVEAGGSIWIAWASHCDMGNYHGWILGYNSTDVSQQTGVFNDTPNGTEGGIWMAGGGISADDQGNLFVVAGNGSFDGDNDGDDSADTVHRLAIGANSVARADYFTPMTEGFLSEYDQDMGTADALLFDDPASGVAPHLLATADKTGRIYLLNRDNLGTFETGTGNSNGDLQDFTYSDQNFASFGFFHGRMYLGSGGQPLGAFPFTPGSYSTAGYLATTPSMTTTVVSSHAYASGGMQPMFSANGNSNGIVWAMDGYAGILYAFDAEDLSHELYDTGMNSARDRIPAAVKFTVPMIANGHAYLGGQGQVAVYGLLP